MRWYIIIAITVVALALVAGVLRENGIANAVDDARAAAERETAGRYELILPPGMALDPATDVTLFTR